MSVFTFSEIVDYPELQYENIIDWNAMEYSDDAKEDPIPSISCQCDECKTKHDCLPILLTGIDESQSTNESKPSTSRRSRRSRRSANRSTQLKCTVCFKLFTHRGDLRKHLRVHSGERPFECTECGKCFSHSSNLTRHQRVHNGDKPYKCDNCEMRFSRKDKLVSHNKRQICVKNKPSVDGSSSSN